MSFFVYILHSKSTDQFYIGSANHLIRRFYQHQENQSKATRHRGPWEVFHFEIFGNRSEAIKRERYIKSMKSKIYLQQLIEQSQRVE